MTDHIRFVGAGKMVSAIVHSLLRSGAFSADQISCCSANDGTSEKLSQATGISRFDSVEEMLANPTSILVLGCKPQQLGEMPTSVSDSTSGCLILSIMAGVPISRLKQVFPRSRNVVRSMPNTPGQIGYGVTGYLFDQSPAEEDRKMIQSVLNALGQSHELKEEEDIDRVTAISGSGPAYLFEFTSALEKAGRAIGLSGKLARELAIGTMVGSARLMESSGLDPKDLRDQVTSPNGTTQAALESFSEDDLRSIVRHAVEAARSRSIELSHE